MKSDIEQIRANLNPQPIEASLSIRLLQREDMPRWDGFVQACPDATFFHLSGWRTVIERAFGHRTWFLYAESGGKFEGVLPLSEINSRLFGHSLSSLPFCVYGGIAATTDRAKFALDRAAQTLASTRQVDFLEYRNRSVLHSDWPSKDLYVTFRKNLFANVEENMAAIPRKQRAMVRKGIAAALVSSVDDDIDAFFAAYSASVHRLGTPVFSKKYFRIIKETFGKDCRILTIRKDARIISSVMSFYFRDEVLPYYGGGFDEARSVAGNDFMYWELMRRACEAGYRVFDFGRSKRGTGSFDFKKNWGFEPQSLSYEYQLHAAKSVPDHNPLNPKYHLFIKAWKRMPLRMANLVGPHIVKNLG